MATKEKKHVSPALKDDWSTKTLLVDLLVCLLSAVLVSGSLFYFSNYNKFAPGGVTGLASILGSLLASMDVGEVTLNMSIFMVLFNAPIFLLVAIFVSRKTGVVLLVYLVFQSLFLMLLKHLHTSIDLPFYGVFPENDCYNAENNIIFAAIGVGVISGFGFSLMIRRFGASGGTYAISALIKHFKPEKSIAWVAFLLDSSIVVLAFFIYESGINPVISTLLNIFISNLVVDYFVQGLRSGYKFEIITDRPDELAEEIMHGLGRGVTALHAQGMYTHSDKTLMICIIRKRQIGDLLKILKHHNVSFSYSCKVNEVYGRFEQKPPYKG